jgi:hypothetical protein
VEEVIQEWWEDITPFTPKSNKKFMTHNMKELYRLLSSRICILYGEENNIHFKREWTPMIHYIVENRNIFNWA